MKFNHTKKKLTGLPLEQRKKIIETAVFCFDGKYPKTTQSKLSDGVVSYFYLNLDRQLCFSDFNNRPDVWRGVVCTEEEFNQVASELIDAIENGASQ